VLVRRFEERSQPLGGLLECLGELPLFLIAPGLFQCPHLRVQSGDEALELVVKPIEIPGKPAQLARVDIGFAHPLFVPAATLWGAIELKIQTGSSYTVCSAKNRKNKLSSMFLAQKQGALRARALRARRAPREIEGPS